MVESPSSESLSSLTGSNWGAVDHEDEVVSMSSTQEGENFAVGEAIETLINKLNETPRSEDSAESIRALLHEAVAAGGSNLRENMALYFVTKRGLEFGMQRDAIDEIIEAAAISGQNSNDQSIEVSSSTSSADKKSDLNTVGATVAQMPHGMNAMKHADGTHEDDLPDLVPDVVDDLLTGTTSKGALLPDEADDGASRPVNGGLLPPPGQLEFGGGIEIDGRSVTAAPPRPSNRAGSLQ